MVQVAGSRPSIESERDGVPLPPPRTADLFGGSNYTHHLQTGYQIDTSTTVPRYDYCSTSKEEIAPIALGRASTVARAMHSRASLYLGGVNF
jgi:hypothetical protein